MYQDDDEENEDSLDEEVLEEEGILDEDEIKEGLLRILNEQDDIDSIIWKVEDTLRKAGKGGKALEFTEHAQRCIAYEEVISLAKKYVKLIW